MKCGYVGCKNEARYQLDPATNPQNKLAVCEACAPGWVTYKTPQDYYTVRDLKTGEIIPARLSKTEATEKLLQILEGGA